MKKAVFPLLFCILSIGAMTKNILPDPDCNQVSIFGDININSPANNASFGIPAISFHPSFASDCPNYNFPIAPADSCTAAPPFCASYLNGYCSSNSGYLPDTAGNLNSVIPCTIENNQWLKLVACEDTVQLVLGVDSCTTATGLEFFILQTTDCQLFTVKSACFEIADGNNDTLTVIGLLPGETYYLMVDGIDGDVCNWEVLSTLGVSNGSVYQEDNTPGQVTGPTAVCAGGSASYTFTSPICDLLPIGGCPIAFQQTCIPQLDTCILLAYDTIWHVTPAGTVFVNNDSMGLTITVVFPDTLPILPGGSMDFEVSVELIPVPVDTLPCWDDCLAECLEIIPDTEICGILPLTVTVCMPNNTNEQLEACPGECVDFYGETFCQPGTYTVTTNDQCGCTSTHELVFDWIQEPIPFIANLAETCDPTGAEYTVSFDVISFGFFVTVNGQPLNGNNFTSSPIQSGQPYSFLVEMFGQCEIYFEDVSGAFTCPPCVGETFNLGTIPLCPGESFPLLGNTYSAPGNYNATLLNPATGCLETYIFTIQQIVEPQLVIGAAAEICDASDLYYTVEFNINSGTPPYLVNGNLVSGNSFQSGLIPSGQPYDFTVTDAATCNPQPVNLSGSFTCPCVNSPGTVSLALINQCESEMAAASFNNDAIVGPNDLHVFILHTSPSTTLGTVIGNTTTGSFGYVSGLMIFGETYFISPAVGPDLGGTVDFNSACFSLSAGQPVVFYENPSVEILPPGMLDCNIDSLVLVGLPIGGSGDFSFEWTGPNGFTATSANPVISEPGAYLLTLTDNLTACQSQSGTAVGSDITPPVFTVTSGEINCEEPTAILVAASSMPGVTYTWTYPNGDVVMGDTIFTNIPGDFTVTALGPNGCTADAATFVTDNGVPPSVAATGGSINCSQQTTELIATSNEPSATFTWTLPDTTTSTGPTLTASQVGSYTVTVAAPNGCTAEATADVVQGPDPDLETEVELGDPTCFGYSDGYIKVIGTTGGTAPYEYTLNDTLMGDFFQDLPAGDYVLTTTDSSGCMGVDTIQLVDPPEVLVQIGDDQFVNPGQSVTLTMQASITPDSIVWYGPNGQVWPDVNSLSISPTENGRYTIVISDVTLCRSSDTTFIYVNGQGKVFVPNVFSPNGDGKNDVMMIFAGGDVERVIEMQIFDRWGEMVFEAYNFQPSDPAYGWDGRHDGRPMDTAVFVVKAMVEFKDGTKKMVAGDVVLMR
ncbi:MAG: gliding motility-associated C-terminal domain-containing protein [Saprospiraceae bacterium]|nr:gliding motility-associated C-terminal domain-containing protein [Saprospiraceae bacterium]MCF8249563.1 gliding motility-associated C-terminal domain-containing protein [Saprospiraceae bacterium]MCF8280463.1 gliding motility-associated C-terminal domain-containing protein [Bacteroidales bacterium]MCF8310395.1 gliding motility-associated C-terminal domain-containing protein [Saprospiraceae bacterium]MCF8439773.1 gliding motility-associated C-terminal domain-containing protein [Saprospiraceae 